MSLGSGNCVDGFDINRFLLVFINLSRFKELIRGGG